MSKQSHYSSCYPIFYLPLPSFLLGFSPQHPSSPLPTLNPSSWRRLPSVSQEQHSIAQRLCQTFSSHPKKQIKWKIHQLSYASCLVLTFLALSSLRCLIACIMENGGRRRMGSLPSDPWHRRHMLSHLYV